MTWFFWLKHPFVLPRQKASLKWTSLHCVRAWNINKGCLWVKEKFQFAAIYPAVLFTSCSGLRLTRGELVASFLQDVLGVCEWCVASVFGRRGWDTRGVPGGGSFFFFSSNFGDVKIAAGESHRSMKRIIMHEPLTQWKWVLIPDTWLVVVSVLLIYSCLGPTAAEGDPLETQSWCRASGL